MVFLNPLRLNEPNSRETHDIKDINQLTERGQRFEIVRNDPQTSEGGDVVHGDSDEDVEWEKPNDEDADTEWHYCSRLFSDVHQGQDSIRCNM
jgi:hypothetical protein